MKYIEDLKHICLREFRHIGCTYDLKKRAVGYPYKGKSRTHEAIMLMIKKGWLECIKIDKDFIYVKPTKEI